MSSERNADDPQRVFRTRLDDHEADQKLNDELDARIAWGRLATFTIGSAAAWLAFVSDRISGWWTIPAFVLFAALVLAHDRVIRKRLRSERGIRFCREGLRRIRREGLSEIDRGSRFLSADHPYSDDLDLFGRGSIFSILSTARTEAGEATLANWLRSAAGADEIERRHEAIRELRDRIALREELFIICDEVVTDLEPERIARLAPPMERYSTPARVAGAIAFAVLNTATLVGWLAFGWGPTPAVISVILALSFASSGRQRLSATLDGVEQSSDQLGHLARILRRIEMESFECAPLRELRGRFESGGTPPSKTIEQLARLVALLDSSRNQLFAPIAGILLWRSNLGFLVERWKRRHGNAAAHWIDALGEFEALLSIAGFWWEHPEFVLPEIVSDRATFDGLGLGHPLIPSDRVVRNDLTLGEDLSLLVISGSNMSGKSTLLRTVGVNTVLALAGAPVSASRLRISPLTLGASIHVRDSLQEGKSRFYAEIVRLQTLVTMAEESPPLLFLVDEVLHGTNSHDRKIGTKAILEGLVDRKAIGLVTTHDLAITTVCDQLNGKAKNAHFEDQIMDDEMVFDYQLRDGVVTKSNALALMRRIGLDV